jgi:hypothetical protein
MPNFNLNLPCDIENAIIKETEYPTSFPVNVTVSVKDKYTYFYEKVKCLTVSTSLLFPFIICCLYFAIKYKNDYCINEEPSSLSLNLFGYLVFITVVYTILWVFDLVTTFWVDFSNKSKKESYIFLLVLVHSVLNSISSIYSIVNISVYNNAYGSFSKNTSSCSNDVKTYVNVLIIMNIIIGVFIVLFSVMNSV